MPLLALFALNFALGLAAVLASAPELRASPRSSHETTSFRAVLLHDLLVPVPIAIYLLARAGDWTLSYTVDASRVPSLVMALLVVAHASAALVGFGLGARLLRDHRPNVLPILIGLAGFAILVGAVIARRRLGVLGTYAQYRGHFGLRGFGSSGMLGPLVAMFLAWAGAVAHLFHTLLKRV